MRVYDWRERFGDLIIKLHHTPFEWGQNDCLVGLVAGTIEALTGVDPGKDIRGTYTTAQGAMKVLKEHGCNNVYDAIVSLGFQEVHPMFAWEGDIVSFDTDGAGAMGVILGERIGVLRPEGYATLDRFGTSVTHAFRIE